MLLLLLLLLSRGLASLIHILRGLTTISVDLRRYLRASDVGSHRPKYPPQIGPRRALAARAPLWMGSGRAAMAIGAQPGVDPPLPKIKGVDHDFWRFQAMCAGPRFWAPSPQESAPNRPTAGPGCVGPILGEFWAHCYGDWGPAGGRPAPAKNQGG